MIIVRDTDTETWTFLETFNYGCLPLRTVTVRVTGVVAAMNTGLDQAQGDLIAFTDDDAGPHPDWLASIEAHFLSDSTVGAVGGRDWVYYRGKLLEGESPVVGRVQWFGRVIGNHHLGVGEAREVDVLKGVNMSFRRMALKNSGGLHFDQRMLGTGAQVHFELAFTLALKQAGWKIIYDPKIGVNHYRGDRFDEDQRDNFNSLALSNAIHNETLILLEHFSPLQRFVFLVWSILIGTREAVGFLQLLRLLPTQKTLAGRKFLASLRGRFQGWRTWQKCYFALNIQVNNQTLKVLKEQQQDGCE